MNMLDGQIPELAQIPDDDLMDDEMRSFMAEGYILGGNCFGGDSKMYADNLMEFVGGEYSDGLFYTRLARKAPTPKARRLLKGMAADELRHARRFAAAYFLITGKRYFPTEKSIETVVVPHPFMQALRARYLAEARDAVKYRMFAQKTNDLCLRRMSLAVSDDERRHAQEIMELIQGV